MKTGFKIHNRNVYGKINLKTYTVYETINSKTFLVTNYNIILLL